MSSAALVTKLFAAPLLIGLASLAGRRWGPAVSGQLGGLPLVGGPVVLTLWLGEHPDTAEAAAASAPIGVWATGLYLLTVGFASRRLHWAATLGVGWLVYLASGTLLHIMGLESQPLLGWLVLPALVLAAIHVLPAPGTPPRRIHLPASELLARVVAAFLLVWGLTEAVHLLGPAFTGVFAGAPVAATVIPAFTLAVAGRDALLRALRGFLTGLTGFASFFIVLSARLPPDGALAWLWATLAALVVSTLGQRLIRRYARP